MSETGALVYLVDDDASVREGVARLIRSAGVMTKAFASAEEFLAASLPKANAGKKEVPSCLVLDVNLPGLSGLDLQQELVKSGVEMPIIFLTGHGDIPMTVRAVKEGAVNFLTKPVDDEELLNTIRQCLTSCVEDKAAPDQPGYMVGESRAFRDMLKAIRVVAPTGAAVLIEGETGTGKELVARAIHDFSGRGTRSFVTMNCAAIPATLLEAELFGHEKGAFTGAVSQRVGRFEQAHGGTIFLDEIGEVPLELQPKLLRVLQEREFERLGSTRTVQTDARLIAATNRDLKAMVGARNFRPDLYYRLNVFPIKVPALRDRQEDIPLLVRHFVKEFSRRNKQHIDVIPSDTVDALVGYQWPGNIRELQNLIERAVIVSNGPVLRVPLDQLGSEHGSGSVPGDSNNFHNYLDQTARNQILRVLEECNWVVSGPNGAAARLGMKRTTLTSRMQKLGIRLRRSPLEESKSELADGWRNSDIGKSRVASAEI
jgi:DNA-binding NtrC family response regulator